MSKYGSEGELLKHAEKAFSSDVQQCQALCRDLRKADALLEQLESAGADEETINEVNARIVAISHKRQSLGCGDCPLP